MNKKFLAIIFTVFIILIVLGGAYFVFDKYFIYENGKISKISDLKDYSEFVSSQNQGKMDDAVKIAQDILDKKPGEISSLLNLAEAYVNKGSHDHEESEYGPKALQIIDQVLSKDPNNAEAYRIQGYAFEIQEKFEEALNSYNKSIEINSNNSDTYNSRGHAYELMGQFQLAQDDYLKSYEIDSENPNVQMNLARIYLSKNDSVKAKEYAEKVVNNEKGSTLYYVKATGYSVLGQLALGDENKEEAIKNFSEAVKILPTFVAGYTGRAQANIFYNDNFSEVQRNQIFNDLTTATTLNPNSSWAFFLFGEFYRKQNENDLAKNNYDKAISVVDLDLNVGPVAREAVRKFYQAKIDIINKK